MATQKTKKKIEKPVIIVVEGLDYLHFLRSQIAGKPEFSTIQLWDFSADGSFADHLQLLKDERDFDDLVKTVGVIRDAEYDGPALELSTRDALLKKNFPVPDSPNVPARGTPNTGYLIIPHDESVGCLEHACLKASTLPPAQLACADTFLACVSLHHPKPLNRNHQAKLLVHATIAGSGRNPALTLGESAFAGLWDFNHPSLK